MNSSARSIGPIEYAEQIAYSSKETLMFSYEMAKKYADSTGCYVECGVAAGAQIIVMHAAAPGKLIYAFDSFQGIPLPSCMDDQYPGIRMISDEERRLLPSPGEQRLETTGATSVSEYDFWQHIDTVFGQKRHSIKTVKGWFEDTVPKIKTEIDQIAILRLDGDLYNSTRVCLLHLFPKVIDGGVIIIDDWALKGCRDACNDYFDLICRKPDWQFISNIAYFYK